MAERAAGGLGFPWGTWISEDYFCRERGLRLDVVELGEVESHGKPAVAFVAETPTRGGSSL